MNDNEIEQEIQAKGLTAPRVTPEDVERAIVAEHYFTAEQGRVGELYARTGKGSALCFGEIPQSPLGLLTFCVLVLYNGFTVTGESACVSPENFNAELGRKIARQHAIDKMGPLMGYALAQERFEDRIAQGGP